LIGDFDVDESGKFYLLDCRFKVHSGKLRDFDLFENASDEQLRDFKLHKFGSHIHWPDLDIHLDLNFFKRHLDPEFERKEISKSLKMNANFGEKMRELREQRGLKQNDFDGLSDRQIRRYENGEISPSYSSIELIAKRMNMSVSEYLGQL
jgi:DNA-binding transcriptional regulator YiaG